MKKSGEEHHESTLKLQQDLKTLQELVDSKEHSYNRLTCVPHQQLLFLLVYISLSILIVACFRLKAKTEIMEKIPNDKRSFIDVYLTKIHKLEDELNEANEKIEQLTSQLTSSNQQAELWSHTAEERLKSLQNMKHEYEEMD